MREGHPNALKVHKFIPFLSSADHLQGGKRPYHTIIPALATRGDDLFISYGVMGGFMQVDLLLPNLQMLEADGASQPQGHVQVLLNMLRGFGPQAAVDAPRFCISTGTPDAIAIDEEGRAGEKNSEVYFEEGISPDVVEKLRGKKLRDERLSCAHIACGYQPWGTMLAFSQDLQGICSGVDK